MNVTPGFDKAAAYDGSGERLPAGGYICKILKARCEYTQSGSEQLVLALDIMEGDFAGFAKRQFESRKANNPNATWPCIFKQFTLDREGQTSPYFKGMLKSIEESNAGYKWNWQEATLANKMIGMIFREEEFLAQDGTIKTAVKPAFPRSVERIRNGVDVPEIKRLNNAQGNATAPNNTMQNTGFTEVDDDELPF